MRLPLFPRVADAEPLLGFPPPPPAVESRASRVKSKIRCFDPLNPCDPDGDDDGDDGDDDGQPSTPPPPPPPPPSAAPPPATTPIAPPPATSPPVPSPPPPAPTSKPPPPPTQQTPQPILNTQTSSTLRTTSQSTSLSTTSSVTTSPTSVSSPPTLSASLSTISSSSLTSSSTIEEGSSSVGTTTSSSTTASSNVPVYTAVPDYSGKPSAAPKPVDFNRSTTEAVIITVTLVSVAIFAILGFCAFRRRKQIKAAYHRRRHRGSQSSLSANYITNPLVAPDQGSNGATVGVTPVARRKPNSVRPVSSASVIAPKPKRGTLGMIRRLLAAPLSPLTPLGSWSPFGRSKNSSDDEVGAEKSPNNPPQTSPDTSTRDLEAQPAYDKYGQLIRPNAEKEPQSQTRVGRSFFSWSSPSISPPNATARATRSSSTHFSRRDTTISRDDPRDSEPARFRTVKSWVAHQQQRYPRNSYRRMPEDAENTKGAPAMPHDHARKTSNPNDEDAAAFKFGFSQGNRSGSVSPLAASASTSSPTSDSGPSPMSASPVRQVAMSAARAQNPHIVNIPSRELSQRGRLANGSDPSPPQTRSEDQKSFNTTHLAPNPQAQPPTTVSSNYDLSHEAIRASIAPPPPIPTTAPDGAAAGAEPPRNSRGRPTSQNTATTSRTTLTIFRTHPGEKWEYRGPKLGKGDRRIDSGVLDRLRKAGWASITRDSQ